MIQANKSPETGDGYRNPEAREALNRLGFKAIGEEWAMGQATAY